MKCVYPGCKEDAEFLPNQYLPLCRKHYALWRFIKMIFEDSVQIEILFRENRVPAFWTGILHSKEDSE